MSMVDNIFSAVVKSKYVVTIVVASYNGNGIDYIIMQVLITKIQYITNAAQ